MNRTAGPRDHSDGNAGAERHRLGSDRQRSAARLPVPESVYFPFGEVTGSSGKNREVVFWRPHRGREDAGSAPKFGVVPGN